MRAYRTYLLGALTALTTELSPAAGAVLGAQLAVLIDGCYTSAAHLETDGPSAEALALARRLIAEA